MNIKPALKLREKISFVCKDGLSNMEHEVVINSFLLCFNCLSFISFSVPAFNVSRLFLGEFLASNDQLLLRFLYFKAMAPYIYQR